VGGVLVAHVNCHGVHEAAAPRQGGVVFPVWEDVPYHIDDDGVAACAGDFALVGVG